MEEPLLQVKDLAVDFLIGKEKLNAVHNISFSVRKGKTTAIVGESGCGKSVTATALMRLLPKENSVISDGEILFEGNDLLKASPKEMRAVRGKDIAMIFQDPMTALNPVKTVGNQMVEMYRTHQKITKKEAWAKATEMLDKVGIPEPVKRMTQYPFEFSGGMRQRIMIAMALSCNPKLLIADEPTTALDVTIQAQILDLMKKLVSDLNMAMILITHDMGVVTNMADDVIVMYAGEIVERGTLEDIFDHPSHPYTSGLLKAIPTLDTDDTKDLFTIEGTVPSLNEFTDTCRFANRCPFARKECTAQPIPLKEVASGHTSRCLIADQLMKKTREVQA